MPHREGFDIEKFRVAPATPMRPRLLRDKFEVVLTVPGPLDTTGETLPVNLAVWRAILRAARIEEDTVYFDKVFAKQVVGNLKRLAKSPFPDDAEAATRLGQVIEFLSQGRPVCVSRPRFAN